MRKCSAGACPPQGSGWGSAKSTVPIRCTKPQLPLFIPWYAGTSRHERFVRKQMVPVSPAGPFTPAQAGIQGRTVCIALPPIHRRERIEVRVKRSPDTSHSREQKGRLVALGVVPSKNHPAGRQTSAENTRRSPAVPAESLPQCYNYETNVRSIPPPDVGPARGAALCGNREGLGVLGRLPQDRFYKRKNAKQKLRRHAAG